VRIQVLQAHRLRGIGVQLCVPPQRLGHALVLIKSHRWQGPEQTRGQASALFLRQAQCLSRDSINAHTNPTLMPDLWRVNWLACARGTGDGADIFAMVLLLGGARISGRHVIARDLVMARIGIDYRAFQRPTRSQVKS